MKKTFETADSPRGNSCRAMPADAQNPGKPPRTLYYVSSTPDIELLARLRAEGWNVAVAQTIARARSLTQSSDVAAGLIEFDGFSARDVAALEAILNEPNIAWVAGTGMTLAANPSVQHLIRSHFFDYVTLPIPYERIAPVLGHAYGMASLREVGSMGNSATSDSRMIGASPQMRRLFVTIRKISASDASVFISGESGTGKELTALAIHERSARRNAPFVAINCGSIPQHLMQSELFGYERGAFTGANTRRIGRIEAAQGGTLFLDEIGDMPLDTQASLLRFLQERKLERVGGHTPIPVDLRVISATHIDLDAAMREGRFRVDLFHRLCVLRIDEPPLRARGTDIEMLAQHMLRKYKADNARKLRGFTATAINAMYQHTWPGNVRELINRVRRAIVMAEGRLITHEDLDLPPPSSLCAMTLAQAREAADIEAINNAIRQSGHHLENAAQALGISRATLYRLTNEYGLRADSADVPSSTDDQGRALGTLESMDRVDVAQPPRVQAKRRTG